jgi:hypothetical protein
MFGRKSPKSSWEMRRNGARLIPFLPSASTPAGVLQPRRKRLNHFYVDMGYVEKYIHVHHCLNKNTNFPNKVPKRTRKRSLKSDRTDMYHSVSRYRHINTSCSVLCCFFDGILTRKSHFEKTRNTWYIALLLVIPGRIREILFCNRATTLPNASAISM